MSRPRSSSLALLPLAGVLAAASTSASEPPRGPPSVPFDQAISAALDHNPTSAIAKEELRRAAAIVEQTRSAAMPTVTGTATYIRFNNARTLGATTSGTTVVRNDELQANVALSVPLIAAKAWTTLSHAGDSLDVTQATLADVRRVVALTAGHAYLAVVAEKRVVAVDEIARDTAKAHFDFAHQRFEGGVGNQLDELRAKQQLRSREAELEQAYGALTRSREALGVFLGSSEPVDADVPTLPAPPSLESSLKSVTKRADFVAAQRRTRAAERVVKDNWADYTPTLTGLFEPGYQAPATSSVPQTGWEALFVLSLPLYDGGLRYGQAKERAALAAEARALEGNAWRQATSDVRAAYENLVRADAALTAAREAGELANQALALATRAYRAGATTNIEVIDAERSAHDADAQAVIAEDAARQARLDMLSAAGLFP